MLKDISKVLVGVVAAKMSLGIWLIGANMLPITILGIDWGFASVMILNFVGFAILILLVYYSWFWKKEKETKQEKTL